MKHYLNYFGLISMVLMSASAIKGYLTAFAITFGLFTALVALFSVICR